MIRPRSGGKYYLLIYCKSTLEEKGRYSFLQENHQFARKKEERSVKWGRIARERGLHRQRLDTPGETVELGGTLP